MNEPSSLPDAKAPTLPRSELEVGSQSPRDEAIRTPLPETPAAGTKPLADDASLNVVLPAALDYGQQDTDTSRPEASAVAQQTDPTLAPTEPAVVAASSETSNAPADATCALSSLDAGPAKLEAAAAVEFHPAPLSDVSAVAHANVADATRLPVSTPATAEDSAVPSPPEDAFAPSTPEIVFTRASLEEADAVRPATLAAEKTSADALVEASADAQSVPSDEEAGALQPGGLPPTLATAEGATSTGVADDDEGPGALSMPTFVAPGVDHGGGEDPAVVEADEISSVSVEPPTSVARSSLNVTYDLASEIGTPRAGLAPGTPATASPSVSAAEVFSRPEVDNGMLLDIGSGRSASAHVDKEVKEPVIDVAAAAGADTVDAQRDDVDAPSLSAARADTAIDDAATAGAGADGASAARDAQACDEPQPLTMQPSQPSTSSLDDEITSAPAAPLAAETTPAHGSSSSAVAPSDDASALSWRLKNITWPDPRVGGERREVAVICQSLNGPCSLISLCNVLILRGSIHIRRGRDKVSYDELAALIADFLVERPPGSSGLSLESALEILPSTVHGLSVNPSFAGVGQFEAQGAGGELALFELCGVHLTHGWVPDHSDARQTDVLQRIGTYDAAQMALVAASEAEAALDKGTATAEQKQAIEDAAVLRDFLHATQTQLTVSGLFGLNDSLQERDLVALFRNSHLSVLYKRPVDPADPNGPLLFSLVTDESLLREPEVVWESIGDVEGNNGSFVNSEFRRAATAGGDYAGLTAEEAARHEITGDADYDQQIARDLQEEEDARAARHLVRQEQRSSSGRTSTRPQSDPAKASASAEKKKKGCTIM